MIDQRVRVGRTVPVIAIGDLVEHPSVEANLPTFGHGRKVNDAIMASPAVSTKVGER